MNIWLPKEAGAARRLSQWKALKPRQFVLYSLFRAMTLLTGNAQEAERMIEIYFLREGQEGHAPLEESAGRS